LQCEKLCFENLPVVILTDSDFLENANKAYRLGAHSYFVKTRDFGDTVKFCPSMCQYRIAATGHLNVKMPARVWPSQFGFNPYAKVRAEHPMLSWNHEDVGMN
jgi:hypothetical protein